MPRPSDHIDEFDLPGIGRRFELSDASGQPVSVVVHHSGRRDLYTGGGGKTPSAVTFTDDQARRLAAVLGGVYFKPAIVTQVEALIGGLLIEWVTLREDSPAVGQSIAELGVRRRTGMTIAAILRGDLTLVSPEPTEVLAAGDRLVVIGHPDDLPSFIDTIVG
jgi:TrkA domain protein